jgi:hypothetical protein
MGIISQLDLIINLQRKKGNNEKERNGSTKTLPHFRFVFVDSAMEWIRIRTEISDFKNLVGRAAEKCSDPIARLNGKRCLGPTIMKDVAAHESSVTRFI